MVSDKKFAHFFFPARSSKMADRRPDGRSRWYICKVCRRAFPIYIADDRTWRESGFRMGAVCKHCLEEMVPDAKYISLEEYVNGEIASWKKIAEYSHKPFDVEKETKEYIESMRSIWDQPEEDVPPDRTPKELEIMLSKGECTIAYANAPVDVRVMCRLCTNEDCLGPNLLGDWEDVVPEDVIERSVKWAQEIKPKRLKITKKKCRSIVLKEMAKFLEANQASWALSPRPSSSGKA